MRSVIQSSLLIAALLAAALASADGPPVRLYELPNLDTLELTLPTGWVDTIDVPPGGTPLTIEFRPAAGPPFEIYLTPQWSDPAAPSVTDADVLRDAVQDAAERIRPQAVEETLDILRLQGESGVGFHFSATERAPLPGEFPCMTQGGLMVGELTLWFTILTSDGQEAVISDALGMIQSAVHRRTGQDRR